MLKQWIAKFINLMPSEGAVRGLFAVASIAIFAYLASLVFQLFARLGSNPVESFFAVISSVGVLVISALIEATTSNQRVRALTLFYLVFFGVMCVGLVALEMGFRQTLIVVPVVLRTLGEVGSAFLGVAAAIWSATLVMALRAKDVPATSYALSDYVGFILKLLSFGASSVAAGIFGVQRGIDPLLAVLLAGILEITLIWSYVSLSTAKARRDVFDVAMWSVVIMVFGIFLVLVSIETISTASGIAISFLQPLREAGDAIYVSAVGSAVGVVIVTHTITSLVNVYPKSTFKSDNKGAQSRNGAHLPMPNMESRETERDF